MKLFAELVISVVLSFASISTFWVNDSWANFEAPKEFKSYNIPLTLDESQVSYADRFHDFKRVLQHAYGLDNEKAESFADWILIATMNTEISEHTLAALVMTESSFRYKVTSHAGAVGPAQVIPFFWKDKCYGDLKNDPQVNILCGRVVLERYKERCKGDIQCALQMYNVGPSNMKKASFAASKERYINKINHNEMLLANSEVSNDILLTERK